MQIARTHLIVAAVFFCVFGASYTFLQLRGHLAPLPAEEIDFAVPLRPTHSLAPTPPAKAIQTATSPAPLNEPEFSEIQPSAVLLENNPPPVANMTLPASDPPATEHAAPPIAHPSAVQSRDTIVATAQTSTALSTPTSELASVRDAVAMPQPSNVPRSPLAVLAAKPPAAYVVAPTAPALAARPPAAAVPKVSPPSLVAKPPTASTGLVRSPPVPVAKPAAVSVVAATRPPLSAAKTVAVGNPPKPLPALAAIEQPGVVDRPAATPALAALPSKGSYEPPVAVPVRAPPPRIEANVPAALPSSPALAPMPDDAEESQ